MGRLFRLKDTPNSDDLSKFSTKIYESVREACLESLKSPMSAGRHGCVIVKNGKIVARGYNRYLDATTRNCKDIKGVNLHAEVDAIKNCTLSNLRGATLIVVRFVPTSEGENMEGHIRNSKPCHKCEHIIRKMCNKHGLKTVIFSDEDISVSF